MIKTSYFAKYKGEDGISISRYTPKWFKGNSFKPLAPNVDLLNDYKNGLINEDTYKQRYYKETLNKLNAQLIYKLLDNKVLLCYETSDKFCHRHIVAEWLNKELGIEVKEI